MAYYLNAWIAKRDVMDKLGVDYQVLEQDFAITTQDCDHGVPHSDIMHAFASYFGGPGEQTVTWWKDGQEHFLESGMDSYVSPSPISQALAALGAVREDSDEFDAVGLSRNRDNDWL